jgi:hypothetical protein
MDGFRKRELSGKIDHAHVLMVYQIPLSTTYALIYYYLNIWLMAHIINMNDVTILSLSLSFLFPGGSTSTVL